MAEIRPFRGLRYNVAKVGALSDVVTPPYDVIDSALQDRLYALSPYNYIRVELNKESPDDAPGADRYARAAEALRIWRMDEVLMEESHPALYVYQQDYVIDGCAYSRSGFMARVRLEPFGEGKIYPHEQTLSGPKADRLALYRAARCNLSPVFGLYPDEEGAVLRAVEAGIKDKTPLMATDHLGVVNRFWPVDDEKTHTAVMALMASKPVFIADGHHRYETGVNYRDELAAKGEITGPDHPANFCLMMLVGMNDPGLKILPTHRLVRGFPNLNFAQLTERLAPEFEITEHPDMNAAWEEIALGDSRDLLGFGTRADGRWCTARLRSDATMDILAADHSPDWRSLGVSILHVLVLGKLLSDLGTPICRYVHTLAEIQADQSPTPSAASGATAPEAEPADLVALVPPATMDDVSAIASQLEKMPPKSTYFYPKLLSGLVINPLR